jgi:nucleoid-associated protein YgaU
MGRETKILLGFLGLLAGVFVGVLSVKLFVPRPPDGAGPDIHADHDFVESQEVVDPPTLAPRAWDFASAPPLVSDQAAAAQDPIPDPVPPAEPTPPRPLSANENPTPLVTDDLLPPPATEPPVSRFAVQPAIAPQQQDPFMSRASFEQPVDPAVSDAVVPPAPPAAIVVGAAYTVQAGDSWWSLAERAYGDGRFYRALFAWNRVLDPRVSLAPDTPLEIPPLPKLEAAWPKLMPTPLFTR